MTTLSEPRRIDRPLEAVRHADVPPELIEQLSPVRKVRLAAEVLRAYGYVRMVLPRRDLRGTVAALRRDEGRRSHAHPTLQHVQARRLSWAVQRTLRWIPGDSRCLMQSLVLTRLLTRRGLRSTLIIGVRPGEDFIAHAWVEHSRTPLLPAEQGIYSRLVEL